MLLKLVSSRLWETFRPLHLSQNTLSSASLIVQLVKNPPAMQETPVRIPGSGSSPGEGIGYPLLYSWASLVAQLVRIHLQCRRPRFNPWVGKIPGEGKGYPLQYSDLEKSMDCIVNGVTKNWTGLSDFHFHLFR